MAPYKSQAQRKYFHVMENKGDISPETVEEYDKASKGKKLPEKATKYNKLKKMLKKKAD